MQYIASKLGQPHCGYSESGRFGNPDILEHFKSTAYLLYTQLDHSKLVTVSRTLANGRV